jgi:AcrR family transcriptional regulator
MKAHLGTPAIDPIEAGDSRRYGGLSAGERRAGRRARLLEAGLEFYGMLGFRHTTIPQLCSSAGVTARHFY